MDNLELYKYFEDRADKVKEAMFKTFTWTMGFAAALLALCYSYIAEFEKTKAIIQREELILILSLAGMVICIYSWFALREARIHLQGNWDKARKFRKRVDSDILNPKKKKNAPKFISIWWQLALISILFFLGFVFMVLKFGS